MAPNRLVPLTLALAAAGGPASAAEVGCWFEAGMLVVPAEVAGIAGDFVLDTGTARTALHETRAQANGVEATELAGTVRLAGLTLPDRPVLVADLDARTWNLPTPAAGVIGADILKDYVVDVSFAPCRVTLSRPQDAPAFQVTRQLDLGWDAGRPVVEAEVFDGERTLKGPFVVATGVTAAVRVADDLAQPTPELRRQEYYPEGVWLGRLEELALAGLQGQAVAAGVVRPEGEAAGVIGARVLARHRLRFDLPGGRLLIGPR